MSENFKNIEIELNFRPTGAFLSELTVNFIDFLLWNRTQIPFTVDVLQKFLEKKNSDKIKCFRKQRAITTAVESYERICGVKELTKSQFNSAKSIIFIFGSSIQTAKEAYKIKIPFVNPNVLPALINESSNLRKIFLQLIQSDGFKTVLEHPLPTTNMFILFERRKCDEKIHENLFELRNFRLNKSCKKFSINFLDLTNFEIFLEDFEELRICDGAPVEEDVEGLWYQSKIFVKGFSDVIVDNKSVWG